MCSPSHRLGWSGNTKAARPCTTRHKRVNTRINCSPGHMVGWSGNTRAAKELKRILLVLAVTCMAGPETPGQPDPVRHKRVNTYYLRLLFCAFKTWYFDLFPDEGRAYTTLGNVNTENRPVCVLCLFAGQRE